MEILAATGYFKFASDGSASERRRLLDHLSSGCGATAFLSSQHEAACPRLLRSEHPLWSEAAAGQTWVGVCFAHLRRNPSPVTARRSQDGYLYQGLGPWFSGYGLMEHLFVAGATEQGDYLMSVGRVDDPRIVPGACAPLAVMNATATVPLAFHALDLPERDVVVRTNAAQMRMDDMHSTVFQSARSLGVARAAAAFLPATESAHVLGCIERQHDKMDAWDGQPSWSTGTALRVEAMELAAGVVQAALVCTGGQAHLTDHPVQRLAREASFYATTQLTGELREAFLHRLQRPATAPQE